jgi:hypothetical protein
MPRILKIDNFEKDAKPKYGLGSDGTCYMVKETFYLEIAETYTVEEIGDPNLLKTKWAKIKTLEGDMISISNSMAFIELKGFTGFVECRPENKTKEGEPNFDALPPEYLEKIGKGLIGSNPMTFEERRKAVIARI